MTAGVILYRNYTRIYQSNVILHSKEFAYIYIPTGSDFKKVETLIKADKILLDENSFAWVARLKKYDLKIRPGKYRILNGMNNNDLVGLLRSGRQEPVKLVLQNIRTPNELAGKVALQLEADSASLIRLMTDKNYLDQSGLNPTTVLSLFIPNTYEFFWNTSPLQFMKRMFIEKKKFWNHTREQKAGLCGLKETEVMILASIIEKETNRDDEKPVIAGVYLNRLKKGWYLQADPALIFAWNDWQIRRVLDKHKKIDSPYNTYLHPGLPPGPICLPSIASIDAVLNYSHHSYMYFCAREDLSGSHNFARTLAEHNRNARRYQAALDKLNIH